MKLGIYPPNKRDIPAKPKNNHDFTAAVLQMRALYADDYSHNEVFLNDQRIKIRNQKIIFIKKLRTS